MSGERTCFVISPIGDPGTDTRKSADRFFNLIVLPAVERFGFSTERADKLTGAGSISEDILRRIQESDLCIVDLTGHNPNVFYECGRRHETGRSCIQLIGESEVIPFDLSGVRTIKYSLSDAESARAAVLEVQNFISKLEAQGFSEPSSGASMSAIAEVLNRIERRLTGMESAQRPVAKTSATTLLQNPLRTMQEAMIQNDLPALVELLPRLENAMGINDAVIQTACVVAINGITSGANVLKRAFDANMEIKPYALQAVVAGLVQYYVAKDEEEEGVEFLEPTIDKILKDRTDLDESIEAFLYNQLSILQHGADDYDGALASLEKTLKLNREDRSYQFNISIIYERLARLEEACEAAQKSISDLDNPDVDHVAHAVEVFTKIGRRDDAASADSGENRPRTCSFSR